MKEKCKKSHNKIWVKTLKKIIKYSIFMVIVLSLIVGVFSLYVGNYLYDYTLNPDAKHYIGEKIKKDEKEIAKAKKWLEEKGENVSIKSYDGLRLNASLIENKSHVYVIMVHGYRGEGASIISPIKKMNAKGYSLLVPDLRGHGESEGDYIGMGWDDRKDLLGWIDFILKRNCHASIVLYGVSMGAAAVMNVAGEKLPHEVKAIIEDCGYTNIGDLLQSHYKLSDFESFLVSHFANMMTKVKAGYAIGDNQPIEQVRHSHIPILFIHGREDDFIPYAMMEELYDAADCEKEKLTIEGAGHANSCSVNSKLYYETVFRFIKKYT